MKNPLIPVLNWISKNFQKDASKMLIWTGVAGWTLSSLAQIGAVVLNPKISDDQKSFLVPQEIADAAVNIGFFFLITQATKRTVSKLFSTGKFAPQSVRNYMNKYKEKYANNVGKVNFDLDDAFAKEVNFPKKEYWTTKNFGTTLATVGAGIVSSNILTPIIRNNMASRMQKKYIDNKKTEVKPLQMKSYNVNSSSMRI